MDDKIYKITLADGTVIDNLKLNGNNFISPVEIDETIFDGNCLNVTINDGEKDDVHTNMELVQIDREIGLIKKWRQRDNRIRSQLKG